MGSDEPVPASNFKYHYLDRYYHMAVIFRDPRIEMSITREKSGHDGAELALLTLEPAGGKADKLFFFFHGMDGDCGDAVIAQSLVTDANAKIIGIGGRGPGWVSDAVIRDAADVIRRHSEGMDGFYLMGVSMGATQVLALCGLLPDDLKQKTVGVITFIPGGDLPLIARESSKDRVKETLLASVGGDHEKLAARSPMANMEKIRDGLPFVIFYNENDAILVHRGIEEYIRTLGGRNPVCVFSNQLDHDFNHKNADFKALLESLGESSLDNKPLPVKDI